MMKSNNRKRLFQQEFIAVLPDLDEEELKLFSGLIKSEVQSRKDFILRATFSVADWSEATDIISTMANAECYGWKWRHGSYDVEELKLRLYLETKVPKPVVTRFLNRLGEISNESSEGFLGMDEKVNKLYDRAFALKKKYKLR